MIGAPWDGVLVTAAGVRLLQLVSEVSALLLAGGRGRRGHVQSSPYLRNEEAHARGFLPGLPFLVDRNALLFDESIQRRAGDAQFSDDFSCADHLFLLHVRSVAHVSSVPYVPTIWYDWNVWNKWNERTVRQAASANRVVPTGAWRPVLSLE